MAVEVRAQTIDVKGLKEFRKALRELGPEFPKALAQAHRNVAQIAERVSQAEARRMGGVQAKSAKAIRGRGNQRSARLAIRPSNSPRNPTAMANVAFWGAKKRTGWYAKQNSPNGGQQHPTWVGAAWAVADPNAGPYAINVALHNNMDDIFAAFEAELDRLIAKAFPE